VAGGLAVIWAGAIWAASSVSNPTLPTIGSLPVDKIAHAAIFGILAWLLLVAFGAFGTPGRSAWTVRMVAVLVAAAYGVIDEVHQSFVPGRMPSVGDVLADGLGALLAVLLSSTRHGPHPAPREGKVAEDPPVGVRRTGGGGDR